MTYIYIIFFNETKLLEYISYSHTAGSFRVWHVYITMCWIRSPFSYHFLEAQTSVQPFIIQGDALGLHLTEPHHLLLSKSLLFPH